MEKVIEVNLGVGMNQLFPETTKIVIEIDGDQELKNKFKILYYKRIILETYQIL